MKGSVATGCEPAASQRATADRLRNDQARVRTGGAVVRSARSRRPRRTRRADSSQAFEYARVARTRILPGARPDALEPRDAIEDVAIQLGQVLGHGGGRLGDGRLGRDGRMGLHHVGGCRDAGSGDIDERPDPRRRRSRFDRIAVRADTNRPGKVATVVVRADRAPQLQSPR